MNKRCLFITSFKGLIDLKMLQIETDKEYPPPIIIWKSSECCFSEVGCQLHALGQNLWNDHDLRICRRDLIETNWQDVILTGNNMWELQPNGSTIMRIRLLNWSTMTWLVKIMFLWGWGQNVRGYSGNDIGKKTKNQSSISFTKFCFILSILILMSSMPSIKEFKEKIKCNNQDLIIHFIN